MWKRRQLTFKDTSYLIIIIILFTTGSDLFSNFIFQNQINVIRNNVFRILFPAMCSVFCIPYCVYCILYSVLFNMYFVLVLCNLYSVVSIIILTLSSVFYFLLNDVLIPYIVYCILYFDFCFQS